MGLTTDILLHADKLQKNHPELKKLGTKELYIVWFYRYKVLE